MIDYHALRRLYQPEQLRLIIIGESPPAAGDTASALYFYKPDGLTSEPLFAAVMKQLGIIPETKAEGLGAMKAAGWLLVDATYTPVNKQPDGKPLSDRERNTIIRDYPKLVADLTGLNAGRVPIILMKTNVCKLLEPRLVRDGFNVINAGRRVAFPAMGHQHRFAAEFAAIRATIGGAGRRYHARSPRG